MIDQDLGDGNRLMLCTTNEIMRFNKVFRVKTKHHPILGVTEEEIPLEIAPPQPPFPTAPTMVIPPPPPILPPLPARRAQ